MARTWKVTSAQVNCSVNETPQAETVLNQLEQDGWTIEDTKLNVGAGNIFTLVIIAYKE